MKRFLALKVGVLLGVALCGPGAQAGLQTNYIFRDDFESGTMDRWTTTAGYPLTIDPSRNMVPVGGLFSALANGGQGERDRMHRNMIADNGGAELSGHCLFSFWMYDAYGTTVPGQRYYCELRGYTGSGYPNGGTTPDGTLQQLVALGRNNSGTLGFGDTAFDTTKYQARVAFGAGAGWFNLNGPGAPSRSVGWHKFTLERLADNVTLNFYVDDVLCRTVTDPVPVSWDSLILGPGLTTSTVIGNAWFDGVCVATVTNIPPRPGYFFKEPLLPPLTGQYVSPQQWHAYFASGIIISNVAHRQFTDAVPPPEPGGPPVEHTFGSLVEMEVSLDGGGTWQPFAGPAMMRVLSTHLGYEGDTQIVGNEVEDFQVIGPAGLLIRKSPVLPSTGQTRLRPVSGGYLIDSFFDIFIEVSTDGGGSWQPADKPAHMELEVDPQSVPPMLSLLNLNPPPMAQYVAREEVWQAYPNGVIIREAKKKLFSPCIELPPFGQRASNLFEAQMDCQLSTDGGLTWQAVRAPVQGTLVIEHSRDFAGRATLKRELAMRMAGGDLPTGLMIRESPTLPSRGGASVIAEPEGYGVSSFFDIFTEISTDGGLSWQPASSGPARMEAVPVSQPHVFPSNLFPPPTGEYVSPAQWQASFPNRIVIRNVVHKRFTQSIPPPPPGPPVTHSFGSIVEMEVSTDGGQTFSPMSAPADVTISIRHAGTDGQANYYDTEMTQLDISGGDLPPGLRVRESPTRPSTGRTSQGTIGIENDCDSFFDIFLEVSTDGGQSWQPAEGAPATMMLRPGVGPQPLIITCPNDITVTATSPAGAAVGWTNIVMGGTPPIQVNCVPANGSTFPIGVTPVTCTATDAAGQTATCSFKVKVLPQRRFFRAKLLPPGDGMYISPALWHALYANGIVISNVIHKRFTSGIQPPPPGGEVTHSFGSVVQFELAPAEGEPWQPHVAPATATVRIRHLVGTGMEEVYETEMLALNIQGGSLPPFIQIRVSPTTPSLGETRILPVTGGFMISSFFDIFTEISTDGGASWWPSPVPGKVELTQDPTTVPPADVPTPLLPPLVHKYVSPAGWHVAFANGVVITDVRHAVFTGAILPPPFGHGASHTFDSQVDMVVQTGLGAPMHVRAPAVMTVGVLHTKDFTDMQYLETEALALEIAGGDLPPGFRLRESPTLKSQGGTSIQGGGGGGGNIRASSFFDIFVELSTDGGGSWWPATSGPVRVQLETIAPEVNFPTPELPPLDGEYVSPEKWHAYYAQGIIISNVIHRRFTQSIPPPAPGREETHSFDSEVQMDVSYDGGQSWQTLVAPAHCTVRIASLQDQGDTRYFDTEMLRLDIAGGDLPPGVMIRESPTRVSTGRTSERSLMIEQFGISSFFDVFTELSVDGGQTWAPSQTGPATVILRRAGCEPPAIQEHPKDTTAECTSNAVFTVRASGTPPLSYQWRVNGTPLPGPDPQGPVLVFGPCTLGDDGKQFDVVVSNACGAVTSRVAVLRVVDTIPPVIDCPPGMVMPTELGECCARVLYPLPEARDACGGVTVNCEPPPGFCFPLGSTLVNCVAIDDSGNRAACEFPITVIDGEPPRITCPDDIFDQTDPGVCHKANVTWTVTATDNCPGVRVECRPPSGSTFQRGTTLVTCTATDAAGHQDRCTFNVTIRDLEPPQITCPDDLTFPTDPGECSRRHVTWTATATDNCDDVAPACEPPSGSTFPLGSTLVTCRATDSSGNSAECRFTVTIRDLERPRLTCPQSLEFETDPGQCSKSNVTYYVSATDNCTNVTVECTPPEGSTFPVGTHPVTCTATDGSGNTASCDFTVTVRDTEPPQITCPPDILAETDPGQCSKSNVTYTATATDNCPGVSVTCQPPSGSTFPLGVTTVVCTAQDASGNGSECTFRVVIRDLEPPEITCPPDMVVGTDPGQCSARVEYPPPRASDNCELVSVRCDPPSGSVFRLGPTLVTCVATDQAGNAGHCTFTVTVEDREAPWIECPPDMLVRTEPGECSAKVEYPPPQAGDNCELASVSCQPPSGSVFPLGPTTVRCVARDQAGNVGECTFLVTVVDTEPPQITCPPAMTVTAYAPTGVVVNYPAPTATDNCGVTNVTCVPPSGSVFPLGTTTVTCTALDGSGNQGRCEFPVTVRLIGVEQDRFEYSLARVTVQSATGEQETVTLIGPTDVEVYLDPVTGACADLDGDGLDQAVDQMTRMELRGVSSLGPVTMRLRPTRPTWGEVEERANATPGILDLPPFATVGLGDSFFDVWVEVELSGGPVPLRFHTRKPIHLVGVLTHKPPAVGEAYTNAEPAELVDELGQPTGFVLTRVIYIPEPSCPPLLARLEPSQIGPGAPYDVLVCWREERPDCQLQFTRDLNAPILWRTWTGPILTLPDGTKCVRITEPRGMMYFRLCARCPGQP